MNERKLIKIIQDEIYVFDSFVREYPDDNELGMFIRKLINYEIKHYNSTK